MKRIIAALLLAAFGAVSCAYSVGSGSTRGTRWQDCPAGTTPYANYNWQDGRLRRDGWDCQRIPSPQ